MQKNALCKDNFKESSVQGKAEWANSLIHVEW